MLCLSICLSYILSSQVYFSPFYCLFFKPTSSLYKESILVKSLVYFSSLHSRFASLFKPSLLYIFEPTFSLYENSILVKIELNRMKPDTQSRFSGLAKSHWSNHCNRVSSNWPPAYYSVLFGISSFSSIISMRVRFYLI